MLSPFIQKLRFGADLTEDDEAQLQAVIGKPRKAPAREDIIRQGDAPQNVQLVISGYACRFKRLADGTRQIMALLVPGDACDLHVAVLDRMDHGIATLTPCTLVQIPRAKIEELLRNERLARALWWATLVDEATLREWLVNMGRRPADQQMAHFFCEMLHRLRSVSAARDDTSFDFPVTQEDLGDILGLSVVHVNRTLMSLRRQELVSWDRGVIRALNWGRLCEFAGFDSDYLHLTQRRGEVAPSW